MITSIVLTPPVTSQSVYSSAIAKPDSKEPTVSSASVSIPQARDVHLETQKENTPSVSIPQETSISVETLKDNLSDFQLTNKAITSSFHWANQRGYHSKPSPEQAIAGQSEKSVVLGEFEETWFTLSADEINDQKNRFRSGYQGQGLKNQSAELDRILKGKDHPAPVRNNGLYGSTNGANAHNGWAKNNLYIASYLDSDGGGTVKGR